MEGVPTMTDPRHRSRVLIGGLLLAAVATLAACASAPTAPLERPLAKIDQAAGGLARITLEPKAAQRIGIVTVPVRVAAGERLIPYSALIYDDKGDTFTYVADAGSVFVRYVVRVKQIRGDQVVLAEGPPAGVSVVSVGATQLRGIELGIGS